MRYMHFQISDFQRRMSAELPSVHSIVILAVTVYSRACPVVNHMK